MIVVLGLGAGVDTLRVLLIAGLVAFGGSLLRAARAVQAPLRRAQLPVKALARTGASGVLLILIMLGGGLVLWVGVPVGWLYIGSQVQGVDGLAGHRAGGDDGRGAREHRA